MEQNISSKTGSIVPRTLMTKVFLLRLICKIPAFLHLYKKLKNSGGARNPEVNSKEQTI